MGLTADDYRQQLAKLLPAGPAWDIENAPNSYQLLDGLAQEFFRVFTRAANLAAEATPSTTSELLPDYERLFSLPDVCVTTTQTIDQRHAALASKMTAIGQQTPAYYISLAATMGYPGATITTYQQATCNSDCNSQIWSVADIFTWVLSVSGSTGGIYPATCNSDCNTPLNSWGDQALECRVNHEKPAHTAVLFVYL